MRIDNGCGLSRTAKLNAKLLAAVLDDGYKRYGMRWMKTLSIAGVDGTIKRRFRGTVVRNRAWMKTGTLKRVKNISGYVKSKNGRLYTVVILVNTKKGNWRASALQNKVIKWLVTYKGRGVAQRSIPSTISNAGQQASSSYYIQTGSFSHAPTRDYLSKISALGMTYRTESNGNYKVLVGPYRSESSARISLKKVRKNINKNAFLISKTESSKEESVTLY